MNNFVKEDLRMALNNNVVTVSFIKADGSTRIMNCSTSPNTINIYRTNLVEKKKTDDQKAKIVHKKNPDIMTVIDVDIMEWRSFRVDSLVDWNVLRSA